jgi:hypothetical protein
LGEPLVRLCARADSHPTGLQKSNLLIAGEASAQTSREKSVFAWGIKPNQSKDKNLRMEPGSSRTSRFHQTWEPRLRLDAAIGRLEQLGLRVDSALARKPWLNIFVLAMVFLACTSVRALRRPLWFDEILTRYIAALPSFGAIYKALADHTESSPPLFHLVSKVSASALGWNGLGLRFPQWLGILR